MQIRTCLNFVKIFQTSQWRNCNGWQTVLFFMDYETLAPLLSDRRHLSCDDCLEDKREDYRNCSVLYCVPQLYTVISTHIWAVLTGVLGTAGLGLVKGFVCFSYLGPVCSFCVYFVHFLCMFSCLFWDVSTSASHCLERLVS